MNARIQPFHLVRSYAGVASRLRLVALVAGFVATGASSTARAQESAPAITGTSLRVSAQMVVGYRMRVREVAPPRIVDRAHGMTEIELNLDAASNVSWRLTIAAPVTRDSLAPRIEMRDATGKWHSVGRVGPGAVVVAEGEPCNPTPLTIRVRIPDAVAASFATPRLTMDVAGGL